MPRGGFRYRREFTEAELKLIANVEIPVCKLCKLLNASEPTVTKARKKLSVNTIRGRRKGIRTVREDRNCLNQECKNIFTVKETSTKKFCSTSCQMKTKNNNHKKGIGSGKMRNPNTPEYKRYARMVHGLSHKVYLEAIDLINPHRHPRTLCGVKDGWQLDHIISIKNCFEQKMTVEQAAAITNLRMLPWKDNLMRQYTK